MKLPEPESFLPGLLKAAEPYEFSTFLLGVRVAGDITHDEKSRVTRPLKREIGMLLENRYWPGRSVEFISPDVQILLNASAPEKVRVVPAPVFAAGRYCKHSRSISSSHWKHMKCGGRGCPACNFKGFFTDGSVGEYIGRPLLDAARGDAYLFHGMGREDVDVRMLGTGRPFVVEISAPRRRTLPLGGLKDAINTKAEGMVSINGPLVGVASEAVKTIKQAEAEKSYLAYVVTAGDLPADTPERVATLRGMTVEQKTPSRVRRRRADLLRKRQVTESCAICLDARSFLWNVRTQSGTYIKELTSSDGLRTRPSISELLGTPAFIVELDVTGIHYRAPWEKSD